MLTENEVKMTANANQQYVDWEGFHSKIIVKIFENQATNNNNAAKRIVTYDNWKFDYIKEMSGKYQAFPPPQLSPQHALLLACTFPCVQRSVSIYRYPTDLCMKWAHEELDIHS
jgi:hypothetical protein